MEREYYLCGCRLDEKDCYFIWFCDEEDGVYLSPEGTFVVSNDLKELLAFAQQQKLFIKDEDPSFYNLDELERALKNKNFEIDCVDFLNIWNLFGDISNSLAGNFNADREANYKIYEKLFWGNNLPAVTPEGKFYEPVWTKKEIEIIREVLLNGIAMFRNSLKHIN